MSKNIAIFASGSGSNAERIVEYFSDSTEINVKLFLCNNPQAGVIQRAERLNIPLVMFNRQQFKSGEVVDILKENEIDWVILAGFLWLVPQNVVEAFPNKIINIHPALLPKFGGKGMYGHFVHEAVVENKETESGITIHLVNEHYDEGAIIFQASYPVLPTDSPEDVAKKGQVLEHKHFPEVIEKAILGE
ncbi:MULTISPECIES: phosphoribosylglycinamide formyltransferase [unclassified Arcicella]|uniref:phosphoribosylglycinamide formyltransferase n=1 Tax=unclassified Arcicella TaxID=2644986 RepID=UPI00285DBC10|nr:MULTISPECIES: phosphoribosylglycinamide formyltransferase [unclassified Arcicella]MDR6560682.1 phosphoribosylglycinamide formyltransferase-1 [Arcicella sp. BE51]MDR6810566.1 phosphoribosylglycinamide formyltransferase-1 [Arcicella sp. BE140]MDR6821916.1 phosphoribosylglycinamide formyltransferase-1 [Arcicella sp. BE139]